MQRNLILTILGLCLAATAFPQEKETQFAFNNYHRYYNEARQRGDAEKEKSIKAFRASFAQHPYRYHSLDTRLSAQECLAQLTADGIFSGLREQEEQVRKENAFQKPYSNPQAEIGLFVADAFNRIWKVADAYRKGELTEEQARNHPEKNVITRAIGVAWEVKADFFEVDLKPGDKVMMCSDGLSNMVEDQRLYDVISSNSVEDSVRILIDEAKENGGYDNITVIVIEPRIEEVNEC